MEFRDGWLIVSRAEMEAWCLPIRKIEPQSTPKTQISACQHALVLLPMVLSPTG
jgi:hypothetical protein